MPSNTLLAYGFEVKGLQGVSTATEAGTQDVNELVQFIVDPQNQSHLRRIFCTSQNNWKPFKKQLKLKAGTLPSAANYIPTPSVLKALKAAHISAW